MMKEVDNMIDKSNLTLRMLGYYNNPGQFLKEETENIEFAKALGKQLAISFAEIDDVNHDSNFADALKNGVFILRDRDSNLYAFWPKEGIARVSNVTYSRDDITILPLEYKYWFTPGKTIQIGFIGSSNPSNFSQETLFEHLRSLDSIGKTIRLFFSTSREPIIGEIVSIGKDYLSIRDESSNLKYVTNGFSIDFPSEINDSLVINKNNNDVVPVMGTIVKYHTKNGFGFIRSLEGETYGLRKIELLEESLSLGSKVVFSTRTERYPNGKTMEHAISVHSSAPVSICLALAQNLRENKKLRHAKNVLQHILDVFPDNQEALAEQLKLSNTKGMDEDTVLFNHACEMLVNPSTVQDAIDQFKEILGRGKKIKDCINRIALGYYNLYNGEKDDEMKNVYRKQLYDFLKNNHSKLTPSGSLNLRLQYFQKLGMDKEYIETLDSVLQDPQTEINKRAKMLCLKAYKYISIGRLEESISFARESLHYSSFWNKAELLLPECTHMDNLPTELRPIQSISTLIDNTPLDNISDIEKMPILSKHDIMYQNKVLYKAKKNNLNFAAEYISILADNVSQNSQKFDSALFLWRELFKMMSQFGYFAQNNFAIALSRILNVSIVKDSTIESSYMWKNKKSWTEVLDEKNDITKEQWQQILYVFVGCDYVIKPLEKYISTSVVLKESLKKHFNIIWNDFSRLSDVRDYTEYNASDEEALAVLNNTLKKKKTLLDQFTSLSELEYRKEPFTKMTETSSIILELFYNKSVNILQRYILENDPEFRTQQAELLRQSFTELKKEICFIPTVFTVGGILNCVSAIEASLSGVQSITRKTSKPVITVEILTQYASADNDGFYHVLAKAQNADGSLTASNVRFEISSKKIEYCKNNEFIFDSLEGGASIDLEYIVKLNSNILNDASWGFAIKCTYISDGKQYSQVFTPLQVHLSLPTQFVPIEKNPYTYGPALKYNDPTFVGRQKEIKDIIDTVLHPQREGAQIIVYGQKRCGKSSLVEAVKSKLENDYPMEAWCVYLTLRIESTGGEESYSEASFYSTILKAIRMNIAACNDEYKPLIHVPSISDLKETDSPTDLFCKCIMEFKYSMKETKGWESRRLVLVIDEFTVLYNSIKKKVASEEILHHWKGIQESNLTNFATIFVGHDITPTFFAEPYASNAAAIIEKYPLSYLDQDDAIKLIVNPIRNNGESRFEDKAVKQILYYTSGSPSYLQIFMKEMVNYINANGIVKVSEIDVYNVAQGFITKRYDAFSSISDFDNLINSGLEDRFCLIKDAQFEIVLRAIAKWSKGTDWCKRKNIINDPNLKGLFTNDSITIDDVLNDLDSRKVIERKENNEHIKIKVGIFKEWLIRN